MVEVNQVLLPDGSVVDGRGYIIGNLRIAYEAACRFAEQPPEDGRQLILDSMTASALVEYARGDGRGAVA